MSITLLADSLRPAVPANLDSLSVAELDAELQAADRRLSAITNSLRTERSKCAAITPRETMLQLSGIYALEDALGQNLHARSRLVLARSHLSSARLS